MDVGLCEIVHGAVRNVIDGEVLSRRAEGGSDTHVTPGDAFLGGGPLGPALPRV